MAYDGDQAHCREWMGDREGRRGRPSSRPGFAMREDYRFLRDMTRVASSARGSYQRPFLTAQVFT